MPIHHISYESLVADPEHQIRGLVDFARLDWDDACLSPQQSPRAVKTASYAQVQRPIYSDSVGRAGHYARWLDPLVEALGRPPPWSQSDP